MNSLMRWLVSKVYIYIYIYIFIYLIIIIKLGRWWCKGHYLLALFLLVAFFFCKYLKKVGSKLINQNFGTSFFKINYSRVEYIFFLIFKEL